MKTPQWALNRIQEVKEKKLDILNLRLDSGDPLTEIPSEIFEMLELTKLSVSNNKLSGLPESISKLEKLTNLDLSNNELTNLPKSIAKLQNLVSLDLDGNKLASLPEFITELHSLITLNLGSNKLIGLSESIGRLVNLTTLSISHNQLTSLAESISRLVNLTTLNLSYNQLTDLPESISKLQSLTTLDLRDNRLTTVPEPVIKLKNLTRLILSNNQLTSLPDAIGDLHNLSVLDLSNPFFFDSPETKKAILELAKNEPNILTSILLQKLNDSRRKESRGNQLIALPESIGNLQNLTKFDLSYNQITNLPKAITKLQKLIRLKLEDNPLVTPPQEVAEKGINAIREYFRQLEEQGQDQLYEAKLLILGEGGAGKTTLAKKIENSNYVLQDEKSTKGVDVIIWSFPIDGGKQFRVNIWDFGGQEIYHATHQFFLTKRSLYALVADTRKEDTDFYYWLNVVELLSDNSPLLIIKNEKQDRHRELNERQLRGQFENLKEILATNFDTNRGLDKVKTEIEHYLKNLPHIGSPLPSTWVRVRERLENDQRNYISHDEYLSISKEYGFTQVKDSLQLSEYLHDIGVFLHFQDEPLLRKIVILKPEWGTDAVYKVLDNKTVIKNLGRFSRVDLNNIWEGPEYENMRDELLQLMMKFRLCYEIPAQKGHYIAPQLLTENQPEYAWNEKENLLLRYNYEFMPKGILLQFIVVMSENISKQTVWKSGVVLENDKTYAEVIEYYGRRQIHVRVAGAHKKEFMTIIDHELEQIHATYKRLKYDKLIPCNCSECKVSKEPHFYHFERLRKFQEDRQDQIQCQQSYQMVNVRGLIDDIKGWKSEKEVEEIMSKHKLSSSSGINVGDNFSGTIITGTVKNSFNKIEAADASDELKETLKQLVQAVDAMKKSLSEKQATEVEDDLEKLIDEVTHETPRQKWYSVSIDGLIKAAENLGKAGEPVIELAGRVLKLLAVR